MKVKFISKESFWKAISSIEKKNKKNPVDAPIAMISSTFQSTSKVSYFRLVEYFARQEKDPNCGILESDYEFLIAQACGESNSFVCHYCKQDKPKEKISFDHVTPLFFGGKNQFSNLKIACKACNFMKGSIYKEKMPTAWDIFNQKLQKNEVVSALDILIETLTKDISEKERSLCEKLKEKEINWREAKKQTQVAA